MRLSSPVVNALTIDVEDYFQINAFSRIIREDHWRNLESRVEGNTGRILDLLEGENGKRVYATFFVVGWIAERFPNMVREISERGHEVACHSYSHRLVFKQSKKEFKEDVEKAKNLLEDITGKEVVGYRAPTYSITRKTLWALEVLLELDFLYDSSIFPIAHDVYGCPDAPRFPFRILFRENGMPVFQTEKPVSDGRETLDGCDPGNNRSKTIVEFPIATFRLRNMNIPIGGGGYFRLFPYSITRSLLKRINNEENKPFVFYVHPWELDPGIPKISGAGFRSTFRTYVNIARTEPRFKKLLSDFSMAPLRSFL